MMNGNNNNFDRRTFLALSSCSSSLVPGLFSLDPCSDHPIRFWHPFCFPLFCPCSKRQVTNRCNSFITGTIKTAELNGSACTGGPAGKQIQR